MLVSTRTPLRVSLFGGGTDYPAYFRRAKGAVIGFTINKYIYISALRLGSFVDYRYRVSYSVTETVDDRSLIAHPVVRAAMEHYGYDEPVDISIQADLPASSGLGSSSAFTVGFINLLSYLQGIPRTKLELAREAIFVEQELLRENVGVQDQMHAAIGGMNMLMFEGDRFTISPINLSGRTLRELSGAMMLIHTGIKRRASDVVADQVQRTTARQVDAELAQMMSLVEEARHILENGNGSRLADLAALLDETWRLKKRLSNSITSPEIDDLYQFCRENGALGGKLCGAGGGGFLLVLVPPHARERLIDRLGRRRCIDIEVDMQGSVVWSVDR